MGPEQASDDIPSLHLHRCSIKYRYVIKNKDGKELSPVFICHSDDEAIRYAKAYASSWLIVRLVCHLNEN